MVSSFNVYLQTFLSQAIEPGFLAAITEGRAGLSEPISLGAIFIKHRS